MKRLEDRLFGALLLAQASTFAGLVYLIFLDSAGAARSGFGLMRRFVFSFHVPTAYASHVCAAGCLVASVLYLKSPSNTRNAWARAAAECACVFGALVVVNGALLTNFGWGIYWNWSDPRQSKLLLTVLTFGAIVVFRKFAGDGDSERKFAAALGIFGAVNVPLIRRAVDLWTPSHPLHAVIGNVEPAEVPSPDRALDFGLGCVSMALLGTMLLWSRARLALSGDRLSEVEQTVTAASLLDS